MAVPPLYDHHFFTPQPDLRPLFVVGLGRSGTTVLRLMFHQHDQFAMLSETWFCPRVWERRWGFPIREPAEPFFSRLLDLYVGLLQKGDDFPVDFAAYRRRVLDGPADLARLLSEVGALWAEQHGKPRWGEKTPVHVHHMAVLARMFPGASFLHIVRDPRDVASSLVDAPFAQATDPVGFAIDWLRTLDTEEQQVAEEEQLAGRVLRLRYEDLVYEPEATLRRCSQVAGVDYQPQMLRFNEAAADYAPDQPWMENVHRPLSDRSIGRWRDDLAPGDVEAIEGLCHDRMLELGYEPSLTGDRLAAARRIAGRVWEGQRAWEVEDARPRHDHVMMHRGTYRDLLETIHEDEEDE